MYPDSSQDLNRETDDAIYYFTVPFEPFNNFSAHTVKIWDKIFSTAEHAYQWKKFSDFNSAIAAEIFNSPNPEAANNIAHQNKDLVPSSWHENKVAVMEQILIVKAEQNQDVREALKRSGNRGIIENSPVDDFWGNGPNNDGKNMIGKIWMKIRDSL